MVWLQRLINWKEHLEEDLFLPEQQAILRWIGAEGLLGHGERVLFFLSEEERFFLERGKWQKERFVRSNAKVAFLICLPGKFDTGVKTLSSGQVTTDWYPLFRSSTLEVWENKTRHLDKVLPLRFGLSPAEKLSVTGAVRQMLEDIFNGREPKLPNLGERFKEKQTLDIAVWVDGHLRASMIEAGKSCRVALLDASRRVPHDARFESLLTKEELPRARIEITLMSSLEIPLNQDTFAQNIIDPTLGYVVRSHGRTGWYLPEVHNAVQFQNLRVMASSLARTKAKIEAHSLRPRDYRIFSVIDWIETDTGILSLSGSMPVEREGALSQRDLLSMGERAVRQLEYLQNTYPIIPTKIHHRTGATKEIDWIRLACAAHALFAYGQASQSERALDIAREMTRDIDNPANQEVGSFQKNGHPSVYRLRTNFFLGEQASPETIMRVEKELREKKLDTISHLQGLSLLLEASQAHVLEGMKFVSEEANRMYHQWVDQRDLATTQLAYFPELYAIIASLFRTTDANGWQEKCVDMENWYRSKQLSDGSFPLMPSRAFAYTRGTGKILEVLACRPVENRQVLERGMRWIETMQYTPENLFFIPIENRELFWGGFRHDAFNPEVWIDAAAHVLLCIARLLNHEQFTANSSERVSSSVPNGSETR